MTTVDNPDNADRILGRLEGRMEEQGALLHQLHTDVNAGFQQVNARIDQVNARIDQTNDRIDQVNTQLTARIDQTNDRIDQVDARVNDRIDKLALAVIAVGGGMIAAMLGIIAALVVLIVQNG